ncbi:MAG: glycosyltransferase, partial [Bryobacteraceae bacterium]
PFLVQRPAVAPGVEEFVLALAAGNVAVFPGRARRGKPVVLIASPYLPFPLSHGGAVRMFNLMRRAARDYDQVLVSFSSQLEPPPAELLEMCAEIVVVRIAGSHSRPSTHRPDVVEEFDSPAFHAVLRQTARKWKPAVAQLEFTQMAQYARDCAPAPAILVEHDITFDLYEQLLRLGDDFDLRRELGRWRRFETTAWNGVAKVVTMSEKDRTLVPGDKGFALANGVDLERFRPSTLEPERARLLFIGSFAHLPNVLALEYFLREVWPLLEDVRPTLHIIAGMRHEYFLDRYRERVSLDLTAPGIELQGFVSDVRPAYERASIVIAPLVASAGTNIKILEAMAMGKAIVSTPAGINGLDLTPGSDVLVTPSPQEMASAIRSLSNNVARRKEIEQAARATVERAFDWDVIGERQSKLYASLI